MNRSACESISQPDAGKHRSQIQMAIKSKFTYLESTYPETSATARRAIHQIRNRCRRSPEPVLAEVSKVSLCRYRHSRRGRQPARQVRSAVWRGERRRDNGCSSPCRRGRRDCRRGTVEDIVRRGFEDGGEGSKIGRL